MGHQTGAQYSAVECARTTVVVRNVVAPTPQRSVVVLLRGMGSVQNGRFSLL